MNSQVALLLIASLALTSAATKSLASSRSVTIGSKTFYVFRDQGTFTDAQVYCGDFGFNIAEIESDAENTAVIQEIEKLGLTGSAGFWIGAKQGYVSVSKGTAVKYTDWAEGEPNGDNQTPLCLSVFRENASQKYHWNDQPCTFTSFNIMCQRLLS